MFRCRWICFNQCFSIAFPMKKAWEFSWIWQLLSYFFFPKLHGVLHTEDVWPLPVASSSDWASMVSSRCRWKAVNAVWLEVIYTHIHSFRILRLLFVHMFAPSQITWKWPVFKRRPWDFWVSNSDPHVANGDKSTSTISPLQESVLVEELWLTAKKMNKTLQSPT